MRRWALISVEQIVNVVEQVSEPQVLGDWHEVAGPFGPGDFYIDGRYYRAGSPELAAVLAAREQGSS